MSSKAELEDDAEESMQDLCAFNVLHRYESAKRIVTGCPRKMIKLPQLDRHSIELNGPGCIDNGWFCFNSEGGTPVSCMRKLGNHKDFYRNIWIHIFYDGLEYPSVSVPFADFFCFGHGRAENISNIHFDVILIPPVKRKNPRQGSFNFRIKMPFRKSCRIEIENRNLINIRMESQLNFRTFHRLPETVHYFGARFVKQNCKQQKFDFFRLMDASGYFWGLTLNVVNDDPLNYFYEAPERFIVDGQIESPLIGSGGEVFFGSSWGYRTCFQRPYFGVVHRGQRRATAWNGRANPRGDFTTYRFLDDAPIRFKKSISCSFGKASGYYAPINEISGDFRAVSFFSTTHPVNVANSDQEDQRPLSRRTNSPGAT